MKDLDGLFAAMRAHVERHGAAPELVHLRAKTLAGAEVRRRSCIGGRA